MAHKKEEKARRKNLVQGLQEEQRQAARDSFPVPFTLLRQLFDLLDERLSNATCDDTLRFTREFMRQNDIEKSRMIQWLKVNGGHCDCEVLGNVEEVVDEAVRNYQTHKIAD